eukprot:s4702_g10.t1
MMLPHSPHLRNQSTSWWVSSICTSWSNAHPAKIDSLSLKACQAKMQDNQATPSFPSCVAKKKKPQPASFGSLSGEEQSSAFQVEATKCLRGVRLCLEELPAKKEHRDGPPAPGIVMVPGPDGQLLLEGDRASARLLRLLIR